MTLTVRRGRLPRLVALAALALATVAVAKPKTTFTIRGAGFGHGGGMSQYGALGYAQHGWNAAQPFPSSGSVSRFS